MTKPNYGQLLHAHFQAGGGPLTHIGIAGLLDVSFARASSVLSELESSAVWSLTVSDSDYRRLLTVITPVDPGTRPTEEQVAEHLRRNPQLSANALALATGCSKHMARRVRSQLVEVGEIHQNFVPRARRFARKTPKRANTGRKSAREDLNGGITVPTVRWASDEPALAKAVRFRELWPRAATR
ncbi:hypothetical protein [Oceanisphaera sp. KMM 10153]|uniref:hypothetical protein n=1 Tax=Oceanisphaera submarina TaxID=3390193 RepID=UPI003976ECDB